MLRKFFPIVIVCLFFTAATNAQTLNEKQTTLEINNNSAVIKLAVNAQISAKTVPVKLELVDPDDKVRAAAVENVLLDQGPQMIAISMALGDVLLTESELLSWFRLRYSIGGEAGIIPLSDIFHDDFILRIIASEYISAGTTYRVSIDSLNTGSQEPAGGVRVEAVLTIPSATSTNDIEIRETGITAADGTLYLDLPISPGIDLVDSAKVKVTGFRNGLTRTAEAELEHRENDMSFVMMNDKTIYQPGQTVHTRGILLNGADEMTVAAGREIEFRIEDEDDAVIFRQMLKTSEFGVASVDWEIPKNVKLGNYRIRASIGERVISYKRIKVSRYDLPNFTVTAKPDRAYYLPNETTADVTVNADYLFGKPVTKGKVRVVEELHRDWNWKEQRYDIKEGKSIEGETDENGVFVAKFDLSDDLGKFVREYKKDDAGFSDRWRKYEDLHFTAYFTDPTTNRTEQKRFDIRITDQPIHVYYTAYNNDYTRPIDLPDAAFFAAYYADGMPAECDIEITISPEDENVYEPLAKIRTNKYGIARLNYIRPTFAGKPENVDMRYRAVDAEGQMGAYRTEIDFDDEDAVQFTTDKAIYRSGDDIELSVISNVMDARLVVQIVRGNTIIGTHRLWLSGGKGELTIPYNEQFRGTLTVLIFDPSNEDLQEAHGLIYPSPSNLQINASFDKSIYKPGDDAKLSFSVTDAHGKAAETALGVTIFDKAVDVRRTTDGGSAIFSDGGYSGYDDGLTMLLTSKSADSEFDLTKPISDDLQLVAQRALSHRYYDTNVFGSENYDARTQNIFQKYFELQFKSLAEDLVRHYKEHNSDHATDSVSFKRILGVYGKDIGEFRDPWGEPYFVKFGISKKYDTVIVFSKGIDKINGTDDDLTAYSGSFESFTEMGKAINAAVKAYHERTGGFIRDQATLFAELGVTEMNDRFGRPYYLHFYTNHTRYVFEVDSVGEDGKKNTGYWYTGDDFTVWKVEIDYADAIRDRIDGVLKASGKKPVTVEEFRSILSAGGLPLANIRDGYDRAGYITMKNGSRYSERAKIVNRKRFGEDETVVTTVITPVTEDYVEFSVRSTGSDAKEGTYDDFTLAKTTIITAESTIGDTKTDRSTYVMNGGAIEGVVKDSNGAVVPGLEVRVYSSRFQKTIVADGSGYFRFTGLPAGTYETTTFPSGGFAASSITNIIVTAGSTTKLEVIVYPSEESQTVEVTSGDAPMDTTSSEISGKVESFAIGIPDKPKTAVAPIGGLTPRLREYFPETLLWLPELVTDKEGKITANFKMADNITTWKMVALASDRKGKVGIVENEITAFQSFFVDLDPPKFLTEGDEISLPVQVRNYSDSKQNANVSMAKADWFSIRGKAKLNVSVAAGKTENAVFSFRADKFIDEGEQRVTAVADKESDAVEKRVTVRPNGQEVVRPESKVFTGSETFEVNFPEQAIKNTPRAELKLYPNLFSHVSEAVDGLLQRPYGCGEQLISSSYPNLMILKYERSNESLKARALKNLQDGYDRLISYQSTSGGFTYWGGNSEPHIALTAYAIRFLNDAKGMIAVDDAIIANAEKWLISQQRTDGSWAANETLATEQSLRRRQMLTSYVARTLAMQKSAEDDPKAKALQAAFGNLAAKNEQIAEPHTMALYGLALIDSGNSEMASRIASALAEMALAEGDGEYWNLETNTPFYGWGTPGRIETTALVLQLLSRVQNGERYKDHISKGLTFLLKNKDRYGVWYSTQTTINVLDTFLTLIASQPADAKTTIQINVNGAPVKTLSLTSDQIEQQTIDLTPELGSANNLIEIISDSASTLMAQVVKEHYVDWANADISSVNLSNSRALALQYDCGTGRAAIMETITCTASIERIAFRGYGMLMAELGTPPGADVDRQSLDKAIGETRSISRYEILPDRIIFYMYPSAGGTHFTFKFRPRYAVNAQTPPSVAYDYYNPLARAEVLPMRFVVR